MWVKLNERWVRLEKVTSEMIEGLPQDTFFMVSLGEGCGNHDEVLKTERCALISALKGRVSQELEDPPAAFGHYVDIHDPSVIAGDR